MSTIRRSSTRSRTSVRRRQTQTSPNNTRRTKGRAGKSGKRRSGKKGGGRSVQKSKMKPRRSSKRVTKNARHSRGSRTSAVSRRVHRNRCVNSKRLRGGSLWTTITDIFRTTGPSGTESTAANDNAMKKFIDAARDDIYSFVTRTIPDKFEHLSYKDISSRIYGQMVVLANKLSSTNTGDDSGQQEPNTEAEKTHYQKFKTILRHIWSYYQTVVEHVFGKEVRDNVGSQIGAVLGAVYSGKDTGLFWRAIHLGVGYNAGKVIDDSLNKRQTRHDSFPEN